VLTLPIGCYLALSSFSNLYFCWLQLSTQRVMGFEPTTSCLGS
jgi:hypothetical protein